MADVSSNEENIGQDETEIQEDFSAAETPEHIPDDTESTQDYVYETASGDYNSIDYSAGLADIADLLKFQIAIIIGFLLVVCFIVGWKHE